MTVVEKTREFALGQAGSAEPLRADCAEEHVRDHPMGNDGTSDVLHGYCEIGNFLRLTKRQVKHLAAIGTLPVFSLGSRAVHARRSTLNAWLTDQEAKAREPRHAPQGK